jgi:hypothetical protein
MILKKMILSVIVAAIITAAVAYGTPWASASSCRTHTATYLQQHPVRGRSFDGTWTAADPKTIEARITGPFQVETNYSTPNGMHANIYYHQCRTYPWAVSLGPRKAISLL